MKASCEISRYSAWWISSRGPAAAEITERGGGRRVVTPTTVKNHMFDDVSATWLVRAAIAKLTTHWGHMLGGLLFFWSSGRPLQLWTPPVVLESFHAIGLRCLQLSSWAEDYATFSHTNLLLRLTCITTRVLPWSSCIIARVPFPSPTAMGLQATRQVQDGTGSLHWKSLLCSCMLAALVWWSSGSEAGTTDPLCSFHSDWAALYRNHTAHLTWGGA